MKLSDALNPFTDRLQRALESLNQLEHYLKESSLEAVNAQQATTR